GRAGCGRHCRARLLRGGTTPSTVPPPRDRAGAPEASDEPGGAASSEPWGWRPAAPPPARRSRLLRLAFARQPSEQCQVPAEMSGPWGPAPPLPQRHTGPRYAELMGDVVQRKPETDAELPPGRGRGEFAHELSSGQRLVQGFRHTAVSRVP